MVFSMSARGLLIRRHLVLCLRLRILSLVTLFTFAVTHVSELHNSLFYTHTLLLPCRAPCSQSLYFTGLMAFECDLHKYVFQFLGMHLPFSQVSPEAAWDWSGGFPIPLVLGPSKMISLVGKHIPDIAVGHFCLPLLETWEMFSDLNYKKRQI